MQSFETIEVNALEVACDGGGPPSPNGFSAASGPLGHPRVFLHIDGDKGEITCPYCSRTYVLPSSPP